MSKSTPIENLRDDEQNLSPQVEDIITQMEEQNGNPPNNPQMHMKQNPERQDEFYEEEYYDYEPRKLTLTQYVFEEAKLPLFVMLLVFMANMSFFNKLMMQYVPKIVGGDGNLNMLGLLFKSFMVGLVFYLVVRFLL